MQRFIFNAAAILVVLGRLLDALGASPAARPCVQIRNLRRWLRSASKLTNYATTCVVLDSTC